MEYNIYSIKDELVRFNQLFCMTSDDEAKRTFGLLANDPNSEISKSPADYALYRLGTFNNETGKVTGLDLPVMIVRANSLKKE